MIRPIFAFLVSLCVASPASGVFYKGVKFTSIKSPGYKIYCLHEKHQDIRAAITQRDQLLAWAKQRAALKNPSDASRMAVPFFISRRYF